MRITAKSYFSGAGGMDLGLVESGIDIINSYEIDKTACATLRTNFSHNICEEDITKLTVFDQPEADVYVGTFPCTHYSTAANMTGTRCGDDLFLHFFRHIALAKPEAYVVENVPGLLKFRVVCEALTRLPDYYVRVECPVNANLWLPQDRRRVIIIGTRKPFHHLSYPEADPIKLKDIVEKDVKCPAELPAYIRNRLDGTTCGFRTKVLDPDVDNMAPTCLAHYAKDKGTALLKIGNRYRPFTCKEYARLQGFPDWFKFEGTDRDIYRQIGNAVAVPVGRWVGQQLRRYFEYYHDDSNAYIA